MIKKITIGLILTLLVLAFPFRLLGFSPGITTSLKILKGLIFISCVFILMKKSGLFTRPLLLNKISMNILIKITPVIVLMVLYLLISGNSFTNKYSVTPFRLALALTAAFVAASSEEVIFRGYFFNLFKKEGYPVFKSLVISSLMFSLIHIINIFKHGDVWSIINQVTFAFALGMLLGSVYALTRNLLFVSVLHFMINIPSAARSLTEPNELDVAIADATFSENLVSTLFFLALATPVLMLSAYYIKLINKREKGAVA